MLNSLGLHRIKKVELGNVDRHNRNADHTSFTCRDITLTNNRDETFTISLYGDTVEDLQLINKWG